MTIPLDPYPLSRGERVALLARVWMTYGATSLALRRHGLPRAVERVGSHEDHHAYPVALVSRAVSRGLRIGPWQPRCLHRSLVLYTLLRQQGEAPDLVIGIEPESTSTDAHAWVELDGRDVGPRPGSLGAAELIRYPQPQRVAPPQGSPRP